MKSPCRDLNRGGVIKKIERETGRSVRKQEENKKNKKDKKLGDATNLEGTEWNFEKNLRALLEL